MEDIYEFDKKAHVHLLNGNRLYGVTHVLGVIAKPGLIQWSANMVVNYIKINCKQDELMRYLVHLEDLDQAKSAHRKKKEKAGDIGTTIHEAIEKWIKNKTIPILNNEGLKMFNNFVNWATENNVKFLESEKHLYSKEMWIGGICDMVFEQDGKKYVGDLKTGSGIYPEHFYQMAAYRLMFEEMGYKDFVGSAIINIKKDGTFNKEQDIQYRFDYETDKAAFLGALAIFKANESYAKRTNYKNIP